MNRRMHGLAHMARFWHLERRSPNLRRNSLRLRDALYVCYTVSVFVRKCSALQVSVRSSHFAADSCLHRLQGYDRTIAGTI